MKKADTPVAADAEVGMQNAALCYRQSRRGRTEVLLITSRDTGRWVLPKGWPIKDMTPAEGAACEAGEEAGVEGIVGDECIGVFTYAKSLNSKDELPVVVAVFPLRVQRMRADFPEKGQRKLKWFSPKKAAQKVDEPELAAILRQFDPAKLSGPAAPAP